MTSDLPREAPEARQSGKWFRIAFLVAIALGCAVAISPSPADPDLWGHVQYGRDVLESGELATTTSYSYTAVGYRWINHENLMELALAVAADSLSSRGMLIAKCALGMFVIFLIAWYGRRGGASLVTLCVVTLLVSVNLAHHWAMRPQLATYVCYALMLALLSWCFAGWQGKWQLPIRRLGNRGAAPVEIEYSSRRMRFLWLMPVLFFFWTNSHGGFIAGFCIYAAYLGLRGIEVLVSQGRSGLGLIRRFTLMIVVAGLATLLNPYGPKLHFWLIQSLGVPRPEITEWHAPAMFTAGAIPFWTIIILSIVAFAAARRSRDLTWMVILTLTLWQSLTHIRHIPFFAIAFGFWVTPYLDAFFRQFSIGSEQAAKAQPASPWTRRGLALGLCLAIGLLGYRLHDRLSVLQVKKSKYPVSAFQFIEDHGLKGRMVVTFNWAQYAIAAFGAESSGEEGIRVSIDGRFRTCYPQEVVDMNFDLVLGATGPSGRYRSPDSPPFNPERILEFGRPDLVLLCRGQPHSQKVMERNRDKWVLLYQDGLAQLWGRRSKYDVPESPSYFDPQLRIVGNQRQEGIVDWPALPDRRRGHATGLTQNRKPETDNES